LQTYRFFTGKWRRFDRTDGVLLAIQEHIELESKLNEPEMSEINRGLQTVCLERNHFKGKLSSEK